MSEEKEKLVQKVDAPATLSNEILLKMLIQSQQAQADANKELAAALLEARKPYIDPKVLEAKRQELEERKRMVDKDVADRKFRKASCLHVRDNGTPNIKWMEHSNGITKGVCGGCFSEFDTRTKEDLAILRRDIKSIRNMGRAGQHARINVIGG